MDFSGALPVLTALKERQVLQVPGWAAPGWAAQVLQVPRVGRQVLQVPVGRPGAPGARNEGKHQYNKEWNTRNINNKIFVCLPRAALTCMCFSPRVTPTSINTCCLPRVAMQAFYSSQRV